MLLYIDCYRLQWPLGIFSEGKGRNLGVPPSPLIELCILIPSFSKQHWNVPGGEVTQYIVHIAYMYNVMIEPKNLVVLLANSGAHNYNFNARQRERTLKMRREMFT